MEACGGAHHLGRLLRDDGFEVRLMSPEYVRPYVKAQKNDQRDADAIAKPHAPDPTCVLSTQRSPQRTLHSFEEMGVFGDVELPLDHE